MADSNRHFTMTADTFERILLTFWVSGGNPDQRLHRTFGYAPADLEEPFRIELELQRAAGRIVAEESPDGELLVLRPQFTGSLRTIVEPYLEDAAVPDWSKKMLKGALRFHFGLSGTCSKIDLLHACGSMPLRELYRFPESVYAEAAAHTAKRKSAPNFKSAIRAAMEWAAEQEPIPVAFPARWMTLQNDVTQQMLKAMAAVWADGDEPSKSALVAAGGPNPESVARRLDELESDGRAALRPHEKRGRSLLWINLTDLDVEVATLADAVRRYLDVSDPAGPSDRQKRALVTALRTYLELDAYVPRDRVIRACEQVPAAELHGLALAAKREYQKRRVPKKRARTMASAIRSGLRWLAEQRLIPMVFQDPQEDPWQIAKRRWIPSTPGKIDGAARATRYGYRTAWGWFAEAILDLYEEGVRPDAVTAEMADAALVWTKERGRYDRARAISSMLNWVGKRGLGPRRDLQKVLSGDPLLKGGKSDGCATYDRFLDALDYNGLAPEWRNFFGWYRDFSTLPWEKLNLQEDEDGRRRFPDRAPGRELGAATLYSRTKAVRWVLGVSKGFLNVDLRQLSLEAAFSEAHLRRVFAKGQELWKKRYEADDLPSPYGTAIQQYVVGAGLIAEAMYELRRHERGYSVVHDNSLERRRGVMATEEESKVRTPVEEALWRGYLLSRRFAGNLQELARNFGSAATKNTVKDIARILRQTPPDWYWDVHQQALALARRSLAQDGESEEHHLLIRDVYAWGFLLSTGVRGQELAHVRLDLQYPKREWASGKSDRILAVHRLDRKNERAHTCVVRDVFVPSWLEEAYLRESRPWLMRNLVPTQERWNLADGQQHQHLIVRNDGTALGCVAERDDRSGRDSRGVERRVSWLRETLKNRFGRIAWERCTRKCPAGDGDFTLHTVRNVMAYYLYQRARTAGDQHPALAAANYLGDDPSLVQDVYGGIDGSLIPSTDFDRMSEWSSPAKRTDIPASAKHDEAAPANTMSLYELLKKAREEVLAEVADWGMTQTEVDRVWEDRRRRIMDRHLPTA